WCILRGWSCLLRVRPVRTAECGSVFLSSGGGVVGVVVLGVVCLVCGWGWGRAIKVYALGMPWDVVARKSYRGLAVGSIGIGSLVSDFLGFTELHFDEAEEWFCSGGEYGALEISGWGVPLEDEPEQVVTAICVVA
ncbi:hypothetical protein, partial [Stenotrophomonas maltophilia]|uniref:hypothetical protein n=1 Tax=Stenotrophomonas maltophilia TaxID=40324 RepID=UPI001F5332AB